MESSKLKEEIRRRVWACNGKEAETLLEGTNYKLPDGYTLYVLDCKGWECMLACPCMVHPMKSKNIHNARQRFYKLIKDLI